MAAKVQFPLRDYAPELEVEYVLCNKVLFPELGRGSITARYWVCNRCGHLFLKSPCQRYKLFKKYARVDDCPMCGTLSRDQLSDTHNFANLHPDKIVCWDYEKNSKPPTEYWPNDTAVCYFKCPINEEHIWEEQIVWRAKSKLVCPYCGGKRAGSGHNLAECHPEIAAEWSPNNKLSPSEVNPKAGATYEWQCENPNHKPHFLSVCDKVRAGTGCVKCRASLESEYPHIAIEWHQTKNGDQSPADFGQTSKFIAWWLCPKCFEPWRCQIGNRTIRGDECTRCNSRASTGEKCIRMTLNALGVANEDQYRFEDLLGLGGGQLRFDHAVLNEEGTLFALIEYHGEQHERAVNFSGNIDNANAKLFYTQDHDKRKKDYCVLHRIPLLVITYRDKASAPLLTEEFLMQLGVVPMMI